MKTFFIFQTLYWFHTISSQVGFRIDDSSAVSHWLTLFQTRFYRSRAPSSPHQFENPSDCMITYVEKRLEAIPERIGSIVVIINIQSLFKGYSSTQTPTQGFLNRFLTWKTHGIATSLISFGMIFKALKMSYPDLKSIDWGRKSPNSRKSA